MLDNLLAATCLVSYFSIMGYFLHKAMSRNSIWFLIGFLITLTIGISIAMSAGSKRAEESCAQCDYCKLSSEKPVNGN